MFQPAPNSRFKSIGIELLMTDVTFFARNHLPSDMCFEEKMIDRERKLSPPFFVLIFLWNWNDWKREHYQCFITRVRLDHQRNGRE